MSGSLGQQEAWVWDSREVVEPKQYKNEIAPSTSPVRTLPKSRTVLRHLVVVAWTGGTRVAFWLWPTPEGNEFCVVPESFSFDASGRADYLDHLDLGGSL